MPRIPKGISWWALSSIASAFGYCSLLVCGHNNNPAQGEALYNLSLISWSSFLLIGTSYWLGYKFDKRIIFSIIVINIATTIWVIYFNFVKPDFMPAAIITAVTIGGFTLATCWLLFKSPKSGDPSSWVLILALCISGIHALDYPILRPIESLAMIGITLCITLALIINISLACLVIVKFKHRMIRSEASAISQSMQDPLTGLNNRLGLTTEFNKTIEYYLTSTERMALIFADLDSFKYINDTFGHDDGDQVLLTIAERIKGITRDQDIAVRMGGDEFVILLTGIEPSDDQSIKTFISRLVDVIREPIKVGDVAHQVGVSCGLAVYPQDGESLQSLLNVADSSMYLDKRMKKTSKHEKQVNCYA